MIEPTPPSRDRWGRPSVGGRNVQRASTFAKLLDQPGGLPAWAARTAVQGLVGSDDLLALGATLDKDDKSGWDGIVKQAQERAHGGRGATVGTALHSVADLVDEGSDLAHLPEAMRRDGQAYLHCRREFRPLRGELFVHSERFGAAGSFDRLMLQPDGTPVVTDLKTSANPDSWKYSGLAWSLQLAVYASGRPYCSTHGLLEWDDLGLPEPSQEVGHIFHLIQGQGECVRYRVNLAAAMVAADLAVRVRNARGFKFLS